MQALIRVLLITGLVLFCELPENPVNAQKRRPRPNDEDEIPSRARYGPGHNQPKVDDDDSDEKPPTTRNPNKGCASCKCSSNKNKQCTTPTASSAISAGNDTGIPPLQVNGLFPSLTATAGSGPSGSGSAIGALMPWADKLYMVSYLPSPDAGSRAGLYAIDENLKITKLTSHNSTYANRLLHRQTNQIIIGAWVIDVEGNHRAFEDLLTEKVAATAEHLTNPETMVYMLETDGTLWECNVTSLECIELFDLDEELNIPDSDEETFQFKAAYSTNGRLVIASNTVKTVNVTGRNHSSNHSGWLAEWKGPGHNWTILDKTAFVEVTGRRNCAMIYALGCDHRSVILKVFDGSNPDTKQWQTYRLPKGSHSWQTEWPRIREVESGRFLMDIHGLFYELSPLGGSSSSWGIQPVSQHLRVVPDFASFSGFLVLGGNQAASVFDNNVVTGQSQSGLWLGKTDDLWSFGKPQGCGSVWRADDLSDGAMSDPFLMTGFDKKVLHLILHEPKTATVDIEVDIPGAAGHRTDEIWVTLSSVTFGSSDTYKYFTFPEGYSAHWVRTRLTCPDNNCKMTAYFHYT